MTLIPLISAIITTPEATTAPLEAGGVSRRTAGYDPGAGHRPMAAALAFGLPAVLLVGVALSPMVVEAPPRTKPTEWTSIPLPKPPPPPETQPDPRPRPDKREAVTTVPPSTLPPIAPDSHDVPPLPPYVPPPGSGAGPSTVADPPAPPRLVLAELDPRYAGSFQPDYPASEQRRGTEGAVKMRVLIGVDGRVKQVELISTDSPGFFTEARRRALSRWRFRPATRGGVPEESWKEMTVRFQIRAG